MVSRIQGTNAEEVGRSKNPVFEPKPPSRPVTPFLLHSNGWWTRRQENDATDLPQQLPGLTARSLAGHTLDEEAVFSLDQAGAVS